ncbi:hypothetical protein GCM10009117_03660 [Gangjinia marincola]|uniref:Glycosyl transferase family 1 domain-containing protein n=1 Tax=Gangjinia marincola TaxID=578463 RepID=A0ABP3XPI0_9FLAO
MKKRKLLIISHTEHYRDHNGIIVGWGPTITEINYLKSLFDVIYHVGTYHDTTPPPSSMPYTHEDIHFIPITPTGGDKWFSKLDVIYRAPATIKLINKYVEKVDIWQLRCPTGIGVYLIPYLTRFIKKQGWYKYAGNWNQENPPLGYKIQRSLLKKQSRKVTINGAWPNQPKHCYTFENPCLIEKDREEGKLISKKKKFERPFTYCFVGRLEDPKGVRRILETFRELEDKSSVDTVHFVGDGEHKEEYIQLSKKTGVNMIFHGFLGVEAVFNIYKKSHFFLLPSTASEGFPKVIAEAMNFGCIPIVSDVSAIPQYVINRVNGFLVTPTTAHKLKEIIEVLNTLTQDMLTKMSLHAHESAAKFTYEYYLEHLNKDIFPDANH